MTTLKFPKLAIFLIFVLTTGCDRFSGVSAYADLLEPIDISCVDSSLRSVEGVGTVQYSADDDEPDRGEVTIASHIWRYGSGSGMAPIFQIHGDGMKSRYSNGVRKMGPPFPKSELEALVPLIERVNAAIERDCGLAASAVSFYGY